MRNVQTDSPSRTENQSSTVDITEAFTTTKAAEDTENELAEGIAKQIMNEMVAPKGNTKEGDDIETLVRKRSVRAVTGSTKKGQNRETPVYRFRRDGTELKTVSQATVSRRRGYRSHRNRAAR